MRTDIKSVPHNNSLSKCSSSALAVIIYSSLRGHGDAAFLNTFCQHGHITGERADGFFIRHW